MTAIPDIIDLVHPAVSGTNIIVSDQIWVLFDREVDEQSVQENLFITGPDQDTWTGPDLLLYKGRVQEGDEENILQSPNYRGFVNGTFTFQKVATGSLDSYSGFDYGGHGVLWRTKAIFTPAKSLSPSTEYQIFVTGDENASDSISSGIKTRTIFDTVYGANLGTGEATFTGSYTGTTSVETFHVQIVVGGAAGTATFRWYKGSNPLLTYGPFTAYRGNVLLADGVKIQFGSGTFVTADSFSVVVKTGTVFTGNLTWPFTTGTGSIVELPSTVATDITGAPATTTATPVAPTTFTVLETSPEHQDTNLDSVIDTALDIVITFSQALDPTTAISSNIEVLLDPVNGDDTIITASGVVTPTISLSGAQLTLSLAAGMINENNVVSIILDKDIAGADGTTLGVDYEFYFTSTYTPMYSHWRKVMLEFGGYLQGVPRDTINLAIYEASLAADQLTWVTTTDSDVTDYYNWVRREFTTCKAAEILFLNILGIHQGLKSKRLGDLEVEYDPKTLMEGLDKALGCEGKWEATLHGGGQARRKPSLVVKGSNDPDAPTIGRGWTAPGRGYPIGTAKSLKNRRWYSGYYNPSAGRTGRGNSHS